jgi:hypothetical protein
VAKRQSKRSSTSLLGANPQEDFLVSISDNPKSPFVRQLVDEFGNSAYTRDMVALESALREQAAPPHDLERRYPLESLLIRHEILAGRATTHWELSLLKPRAAELAARAILERRPRHLISKLHDPSPSPLERDPKEILTMKPMLHPTDSAFECRAAKAIDIFFMTLRDTDRIVAFAIGTDLAQLDVVFQKFDIRKGFDTRWLSGFFLYDNGRRDHRELVMVRGQRTYVTATLRAFNQSAKISGYVVTAADRSYEIFRAGENEPVETGRRLTWEVIELAYSKLTNAKQRFVLAHAYASCGGVQMRKALHQLGYL